MRVLPEGQSESAADCSDEKAWFCLLQVFIRNRAHSPLFGKAAGMRQMRYSGRNLFRPPFFSKIFCVLVSNFARPCV